MLAVTQIVHGEKSTLKHSDEILKAFERTIEKDTDPKNERMQSQNISTSKKFRCLFSSYYRISFFLKTYKSKKSKAGEEKLVQECRFT